MKLQNTNRSFFKGLTVLASLFTGLITACSSNSSSDIGPTAGGVTDIGNSIASGVVLDVTGNPVKGARVVAYYDSWRNSSIQDSVETTADDKGKYELNVDSSESFVLYASAGESDGFANSEHQAAIIVDARKTYSGRIAGRNSGFVRIIGRNLKTELDSEGNFFFKNMPSGDITIAYTDSLNRPDYSKSEVLQSRVEFTTYGSQTSFELPTLNFYEGDTTWLVANQSIYYEGGNEGIRIFTPDVESWEPPTSVTDTAVADTSSEIDTIPEDTVETLVSLSLESDVRVFDNDSTEATDVEYVDGISGKAILLKPGQFISLDSLDICDGDFTISLWTKWNGPNGEHQILVSERAYWSDSTSRFQWHFESNKGRFTVMKSMPAYPYAVSFGDSSAVPVGEWANLVLVSKEHKVSMYVNGKVLTTQDEDGNEISEYKFEPNDLDRKVPLRIGGNEVDTETWNGVIDEVVIENVARSADWIKDNYKKFAEP